MTFTADTVTRMVTLATPDYSWPNGGSRPTLMVRNGLFAFLASFAGMRCVFCGEHTDKGYACHIVSSGRTGHDGRKGYLPGNLAYGCEDCNEIDRGNGPVIAFDSILHPELIPTEWPARKELELQGIAIGIAKNAKREVKRQKRGME